MEQHDSISNNIAEVLEINNLIIQCDDIELEYFYKEFSSYSHPQIACILGYRFSNIGNNKRAKECFVKGASYGLKYPCALYDSFLLDSIAQSMKFILTDLNINVWGDPNKIRNLISLCYVFLSKSIELMPRRAFDSYWSRADLFDNKKTRGLSHSVVMNNYGVGTLLEPFIVSDFYYCSQAVNSPHKEPAYLNAKAIHKSIDGIAVSGKSANEYTLQELAELGEKRHEGFFRKLELDYKDGKFDFTERELELLF